MAISSREPLDGEAMPQVVRSRSNATLFPIKSGLGKQAVQCCVGRVDRQSSLIDADEEPSLRPTRRVANTLGQVPVQLTREGSMKRNPSGSPLESLNKQDPGSRIHIAHAEAERLSKADARAVQGEHERSV